MVLLVLNDAIPFKNSEFLFLFRNLCLDWQLHEAEYSTPVMYLFLQNLREAFYY